MLKIAMSFILLSSLAGSFAKAADCSVQAEQYAKSEDLKSGLQFEDADTVEQAQSNEGNLTYTVQIFHIHQVSATTYYVVVRPGSCLLAEPVAIN